MQSARLVNPSSLLSMGKSFTLFEFYMKLFVFRFALGGGNELAMMCDIVYAGDKVKLVE